MPQRRSTLIVFEKKHPATLIIPRWLRLHPKDKVTVFFCPPMGSFRFRLPRELSLSKAPIIQDIALETRHWHPCPDGRPSIFDRDFAEMAATADHIVCATDTDPQGARNFLDLHQYHRIQMPLKEISWLPLRDLTATHIDERIAQDIRADDPGLARLAGFGRAKQYFDYLYLINALPVFGKTLRLAGINTEEDSLSFLSKFTLQTLYLLDRAEGPQTEGQIIGLMNKNPASGRRSPVGTPISSAEIITWLIRSGCIEPTGTTERPGRKFVLAARGRRLLSLLHKDCFDPDLTARIEDWGEAWPASRPAIERYIRTFFGKQKRFLAAKG